MIKNIINKSKNFVPGFVCVLHTFGRPLEWNPHIHCLITEGGYSDDAFWLVVKHFEYSYLRKAFQNGIGEGKKQLDLGPFNSLFEGASSKFDIYNNRKSKYEENIKGYFIKNGNESEAKN